MAQMRLHFTQAHPEICTHDWPVGFAYVRGPKAAPKRSMGTTPDRPTKRIALSSPHLVPDQLEFEGREAPTPRKRPRYNL